MSFDKYVMPKGLKEAVDISLPDTKAVFSVMLPSNTNELYSSRLMAALDIRVGESTEADLRDRISTAEFQKRQREVFFGTCIVSAKGLPKGVTIESFFEKYALAAEYVYTQAAELAVQADQEVNDVLGKSASIPNGKDFGAESATNMN